MLASITPLGERGRGASWHRTVTAYVLASTFGGAAIGAVLGTVGQFARIDDTRWTLAAGGVAALIAVGLDLAGRLPTLRRQVDETWLTRYRDWVYGAGFGFQLGVGATTIVSSAALYLTWLVELLIAAPGLGAVVGATFGLSRALPLLGTAHIFTADGLRVAQRRWQGRLPAARRTTIAVQAAAVVAMLAWVAAA